MSVHSPSQSAMPPWVQSTARESWIAAWSRRTKSTWKVARRCWALKFIALRPVSAFVTANQTLRHLVMDVPNARTQDAAKTCGCRGVFCRRSIRTPRLWSCEQSRKTHNRARNVLCRTEAINDLRATMNSIAQSTQDWRVVGGARG